MTAKTLLVDSVGIKLDQLTENVAGGDYVFRGKFAQADRPTANKRVYSRVLWERELGRLKERIAQGKIFGELDHPEDGKTKLQRAAVLIQNLWIDQDGQVMGEMKVLNTSMGKELQAIVDGGGAIGVSSRGYGSVRMDGQGNAHVQDDFTLLTFDPVADPAEETAYPVMTRVEKLVDPLAAPAVASPPADEALIEPETAPSAVDEEVQRDHLNQAVARARKMYEDAAKSKGHKEALSYATDEAFKTLMARGGSYDRQDFSIDVAAEVISIKIKESKDEETMGNENQKVQFENIKDLVQKTVQESINSVLSEKDQVIAALRAEALLSEAEIKEAKIEIQNLNDAVKELGYGLYLQQHLASHPRLKQIKESLGDLTDIKSLEELQTKIAVYTAEVSRLNEDAAHTDHSLTEDLKATMAQLTETKTELKTIRAEREEAIQIGMEVAASLYLERRISKNPRQSEIRTRFKEMKDKSLKSVQSLLEEYKAYAQNESSDFQKIRSRLSKKTDADQGSLVEDHVKQTKPPVEESIKIDGVNLQSLSELRRLSGLKDK